MSKAHQQKLHVPNGLVKDALEVALRQGRALEVLVRPDILGAHERLVVRHGLHALLTQRFQRRGVLAEIQLRADENDRHVRCVVVDFGVPLGVVLVLWQCSGYSTAAVRLPEFVRPGAIRTFALTLSNDGGLTMEKQIKKTSVCG